MLPNPSNLFNLLFGLFHHILFDSFLILYLMKVNPRLTINFSLGSIKVNPINYKFINLSLQKGHTIFEFKIFLSIPKFFIRLTSAELVLSLEMPCAKQFGSAFP